MRRSLIARSAFLFVSIALFIGIYSVPATAQADTTSCNTPIVGNFTPYVYNGHLDSFDYYVSDPTGTSYLPLSINVAGKSVDWSYTSIWSNTGNSNMVKVHVDVPDELALPIDTVVTIGLLQVTQGPPPVCLSQATFHVNLPHAYVPGVAGQPNPVVSYPNPPVTTHPHPVTNNPGTPVTSNPSTTTQNHPSTTPIGTPVLSTGGECRTVSTPWLMFLALLDILVSIVLLFLMSFIAHSNGRLIAAVLIPPAVFIGLWYFINTCHGGIWFPILSVILAIIILTGSGSPEYFERYRVKTLQFFGIRQKNTQLKLSDVTAVMERK